MRRTRGGKRAGRGRRSSRGASRAGRGVGAHAGHAVAEHGDPGVGRVGVGRGGRERAPGTLNAGCSGGVGGSARRAEGEGEGRGGGTGSRRSLGLASVACCAPRGPQRPHRRDLGGGRFFPIVLSLCVCVRTLLHPALCRCGPCSHDSLPSGCVSAPSGLPPVRLRSTPPARSVRLSQAHPPSFSGVFFLSLRRPDAPVWDPLIPSVSSR